MKNRVTQLLQIQYPIVQGGMVWCSGWRLASAVSEAGGLGTIGAGSMYPDVLREHIKKCKLATRKPFAVNVPLLYPDIEDLMKIILEEQVPIVITSAGNPKTWTQILKEEKRTVMHVISGSAFAQKAEAAGVDALIAEGFEAGGHNGREETTTFCLIPMVRETTQMPLLAAGGIGSGKAMLAAFALGAEGVQVGTRFAACEESSAHEHFKQRVREAKEGDTDLVLKKLAPVRLLKNDFYQQVKQAEIAGANKEELEKLLGTRRAKKGIFEGDMVEGELEIGQISAMIKQKESAEAVVQDIWQEYLSVRQQICQMP
ncbi:nitronate monooxygenase [Cytophagales bacterium LB-30]|uniref:Nitronate monooxygenase n=1 Tax=Shiella aurantiaca TaxID=3058365 RepID=A0ABT8F8M0_9BACT|nr:nitronate monooxygenase [Shiella aurantiaca]MDN4166787.1 nitronate monooxygenase [Shiella aurantiaca]